MVRSSASLSNHRFSLCRYFGHSLKGCRPHACLWDQNTSELWNIRSLLFLLSYFRTWRPDKVYGSFDYLHIYWKGFEKSKFDLLVNLCALCWIFGRYQRSIFTFWRDLYAFWRILVRFGFNLLTGVLRTSGKTFLFKDIYILFVTVNLGWVPSGFEYLNCEQFFGHLSSVVDYTGWCLTVFSILERSLNWVAYFFFLVPWALRIKTDYFCQMVKCGDKQIQI